jgi:hypothetical protein
MLRIGIVGSRRRNTQTDKLQVTQRLIQILENSEPFSQRFYDPSFEWKNYVTLVSGGCPKGADRFAEELAVELNLPIILHLPDKSKLPACPQRWHFAEINFERNQWIARDSDILIACVADDRKGGTEDTIKHFLKTYKKSFDCLIVLRTPGLDEGGFGL